MHLNKRNRTKYIIGGLLSCMALSVRFPDPAFASDNLTVQMADHIKEIEESMSEYPGDKELSKRYEEALSLQNQAEKCLKYAEDAVEMENLYIQDLPTAGISSYLTYSSTPDFWIKNYYQYAKECIALDSGSDYFNGYYNLPEQRKKIVNTALSCEGRISYHWGQKPSTKEWNENWDTSLSGLDCSGFVAWVYWYATDSEMVNSDLLSTFAISRNVEKIDYEELLPGDLGMIIDSGTFYTDVEGEKYFSYEEAAAASQLLKEEDDSITGRDVVTHTNHVGIYVGKDEDGNDIWCHCAGGSYRTVVVNNYGNFHYFYRVLDENEEGKDE